MRHDAGEFACDGAVHGFRDGKIGREENIKVPLMDLHGIVSQ